ASVLSCGPPFFSLATLASPADGQRPSGARACRGATTDGEFLRCSPPPPRCDRNRENPPHGSRDCAEIVTAGGGLERVRISASRELLARRPDVWGVVAEPYHLADWWPGVAGVQPDRRGSAAGARWQPAAGGQPTFLPRPETGSVLVVTAADGPMLFAFHLTTEKLDVRVDLEASAADRTRVT